MTVAAGLSAAKNGFDLLKNIREQLVKSQVLDPAELSGRLLGVQELMVDVRTALAEAQEEKASYEAQIAELKRMAQLGKEFKPAHGLYWTDGFPYCPTCWDVDRKPVRLAGPVRNGQTGRGDHNQWTCPFHKSVFFTYWNAKAPE
jgi:hypothetical protein